MSYYLKILLLGLMTISRYKSFDVKSSESIDQIKFLAQASQTFASADL